MVFTETTRQCKLYTIVFRIILQPVIICKNELKYKNRVNSHPGGWSLWRQQAKNFLRNCTAEWTAYFSLLSSIFNLLNQSFEKSQTAFLVRQMKFLYASLKKVPIKLILGHFFIKISKKMVRIWQNKTLRFSKRPAASVFYI